MCAIAALLWLGVFFFAQTIGADSASAAKSIADAKRSAQKRDSDARVATLLEETADARAQLEQTANTDAVSLAGAISKVGTDAGVPVSVSNVVQGPGPKLPPGAVLHPASLTFSVKASGPFTKLITAAELLSRLPAASSLDHLQLNLSDSGWDLNADVHVIVGNLSS